MMNAERRTDVAERKERIEQLKARAEELSKGSFTSFTSDECPLEVQEEFWRRVVEVEERGFTTLAKVLEDGGFELTAPDKLTDEQLAKKLWALIGRNSRPGWRKTSRSHCLAACRTVGSQGDMRKTLAPTRASDR